LITFVLLTVIIIFLIMFARQNYIRGIVDFESCADAGYPVMKSYPRQCRTSDGRLFVEEIPSGNGDNRVGLESCPDEWIRNEMPCVCLDGKENCESCQNNREYFIVDGERRELNEYNVTWVEENCELEKTIVY